MPKNFADALGETLQDTGRELVPFIQLMRRQRAESAADQFERDLKLSKFQLDVDQLDIQRQGLDERAHQSRLAMYRYIHPRATATPPNTIEGLITRYLGTGGKTTDPYVTELSTLAGQLSEARRADPRVPRSETGAGMARGVMGDISKATAAFNTGKIGWDKSSAIQEGQGRASLGTYPGEPVDTLGILSAAYEEARQFGEQHGFTSMIRANPKLNPYMMQIESGVRNTAPGWNPMAGSARNPLARFADPGMSATHDLNQLGDLDSWGLSEYGNDWNLLTPEQKRALAQKNGIM